MTEPSTDEIQALCVAYRQGTIALAERLLADLPIAHHHIVLHNTGGWLFSLAARTIWAAHGKDLDPHDPRVVSLIREWGEALTAYPDNARTEELTNQARERFYQRLVD